MARKEAGVLQQDMQEQENNGTVGPGAPDGGMPSGEPPRNPNMKWYIIHSYS